MIPYSPEVFFSFLAQYNAAIWPAQPIAWLLGAAAAVLATRKNGRAAFYADRLVAGILALAWIWTGAVYHLGYFAAISFWDFAFGAIFLVQGLGFLWSGLLRNRLRLRPRDKGRSGWTVPAFAVLALLIHPLLSAVPGHGWAEIAWFGVSPAATVILTLGILLQLAPGHATYLLVLPLLLCVTGGLQAYLLPLPQNWLLAAAGLIALALAPARKPAR